MSETLNRREPAPDDIDARENHALPHAPLPMPRQNLEPHDPRPLLAGLFLPVPFIARRER